MSVRTPSCQLISIHALREEGDEWELLFNLSAKQFLSTPSARRATDKLKDKQVDLKFLSTPSARRATFLYAVGKGFT